MKCILLIRVSTERQNYDSQTEEVKRKALYDGYKEEDIIIIEDKESAVKLSEDERKGLNKMKFFIETDKEINCVYVWEISRISRRMKDIFSIRDYLKDHRVQLIMIKEGLKAFDVDKDFALDFKANMIFSIMGSFAESEAETLKERARRGKDDNKNKGLFNGGYILFGYKVVNKVIVVDEDEAEIVKLIYDLYCNKLLNSYDIAKELNSRGFKTKFGKRFNNSVISKILREERYIGKIKGFDRIISESLFNKASYRRDNNRWHSKYKNNNIYYGSKLLFASKDDKSYSMFPQLSDCAYCCPKQNISVNINIIDSLLWFAAKQRRKQRLSSKEEKEKVISKYQVEIIDKRGKIKTLEDSNEDRQNRIDNILMKQAKDENFKMSSKAVDKLVNGWSNEIDENKKLIERLNDEISSLSKDIENFSLIRDEKIEGLDLIRSDEDRKRIINEEILRVEISRLSLGRYGVLIKFGQRIIEAVQNFIVISTAKKKQILVPFTENKEELKQMNEKLLRGEEVERVERKIGYEELNIEIEKRFSKEK